MQEALRRYEAVRARRTRQLIRLGPRIAAWTTTRSALRWRVRAIAIRMLSDWLFKQTLNAHARDPHRALRAWQA